MGIILSSASLTVCKIIKEKDNRDFYFGKYILEPLVITFNSFILIVMCLWSMVNSIKTLMSGGNSVDIGSAMIYAIVSTLGCGAVYWIILKKNKKEHSELIKSESVQWFMDFLLSAAVLVGFVVAIILSKTSYSYMIRYVDPLMVLAASMVCVKNPIKRFVTNLKEVIGMITPEKVNAQVEKQVLNIKKEYGFTRTDLRVMKRGRSIKIEVDFVNEEDLQEITLDEMNDIKHKIYSKVDTGKYYKDLELTFVIGDNVCVEMTA